MTTLQQLKVGDKLTQYSIDSAMAMTWKREITISYVGHPSEKMRYKERGKRKEFYLLTRDFAIFHGWDQPILCDTDDKAPADASGSKVMRGNACFNFIGSKDAVKSWIDNHQINPNFKKSNVIAIDNGVEIVIYPELNTGNHAVISRMLEGAL